MTLKKGDRVKFATLYGKSGIGYIIDTNEQLARVIVDNEDHTEAYEVAIEDVVLDCEAEPISDNVNHPKHYSNKPDGIETIKIVDHMVMGLKSRAAVRIGNATKYMDRHQSKNGKEDIKKAIWYLQDYVDHYEEYNEQ